MLRFLLLLCCCSFALGASQLLTEKISLKNGDGTVIWSLKPQDDGGAKLLDANEQELARYTINANGKIVVKDAADTRLGTVEGEGGKYKFVGEVEGETHWVVQRRDDGDWKVEDGGERKLLKLSAKDYGWKAKNDAGEDFFKVKNKDGKKSVRRPDDSTIIYTKQTFAMLALAVMAVENIPVAERGGLALRLHNQEMAP